MTHLLIASVAIGTLLAVLAIVFVLQRERPVLRRVGVVLLLAIVAAAMVAGILSA
ncbi:MAG: hypothetical protein AAGF30_11590 [Pseudomonadota bacterium]